MGGSQFSLQALAMPPPLSVLVVLLATYVTLELGQRLRHLGAHAGWPWWLASALGLSIGLWSGAVLSLAESPGPEIGFAALAASGAALLSMALAIAGLRPFFVDAPSRRQRLVAAGLLGGAAVVAQGLVVASLGLAPGVRLSPALTVAIWLACSAGFAAGQHLLTLRRSPVQRPQRLWQATVAIVAPVVLSQVFVMHVAGRSGTTPLPLDGLVGASTMSMLASIGGTEALLLMLLARAVEARLRGTLESARSALQGRALRDELTGLPNRVGFEAVLARTQQQVDARRGQLGLLVVALDGFKQVNESYGHPFGDELLRSMARRLGDLAPPQHVARLGGDEFLLLLADAPDVQQAGAKALRALEAIAAPCRLEGRDIDITASVGVALYPQHGAVSTLIKHASVAMRASKHAGGATYSFFDSRMMVDSRDQAELLRDLRLALARDQFELYFQPKIHAPSAQITGAEALLRWHHPQRGMISPTVFVPLAERSGLINAIGAWVIDEACRQARVWRDQGLRMRVAVNLSAHQLHQADLPQRVADALRKHQINPDLLTCEITESVAMENTEATMQFFKELAAVGVHISIDDFGSGYSSLAYLRKLPAGELKIDRAFVLDLEQSEEARAIAGAVVQLARALNLKVVAEGVETEAQFQILRTLGCDELQGFLFAKPMSAKALARWAIADEGPRSIEFSEALFQGTREMAL